MISFVLLGYDIFPLMSLYYSTFAECKNIYC